MTTGILFCTPCYGGMVTAPHFMSCLALKDTLGHIGIEHDWLIGRNESLVHRARMEMTASFLNTDYSHMMWLDADIEFAPEDVAKVWNLDADVGVGAYQMKTSGQKQYAAWKDGKLITDLSLFDGPTEVDYAGTGFMLIKREAIEKVHSYLVDQHSQVEKLLFSLMGSELQTADRETVCQSIIDRFSYQYASNSATIPALYMTPIENGILLSEDYYFSAVARRSGLKIMLDPEVRLKHWGQCAYG